MVKVTIENNGEVYQHEGDLFIGQISTRKGNETTASTVVVGTEAPQRMSKNLERMAISIIKELSKDPVIVCGNLIEIEEGINKELREYMKGNLDAMTDSIREFLMGKETMK